MKVIFYSGPKPEVIPADSVLIAQEGTRLRSYDDVAFIHSQEKQRDLSAEEQFRKLKGRIDAENERLAGLGS